MKVEVVHRVRVVNVAQPKKQSWHISSLGVVVPLFFSITMLATTTATEKQQKQANKENDGEPIAVPCRTVISVCCFTENTSKLGKR